VSIGAQSFDEKILGALGRRHGADAGAQAVRSARAAGFRTVSLDLIYGHPTETARSWAGSLDRALDLPIDHISTYALTVERGTVLSREILAGATPPNEDTQAERYETFCEQSSVAGPVRGVEPCTPRPCVQVQPFDMGTRRVSGVRPRGARPSVGNARTQPPEARPVLRGDRCGDPAAARLRASRRRLPGARQVHARAQARSRNPDVGVRSEVPCSRGGEAAARERSDRCHRGPRCRHATDADGCSRQRSVISLLARLLTSPYAR